ncbi:hypothetical protein F4680DRAFT_468417 [Xylaria scruposa]|nr:hypothetical protein F4680DRAFT_468417 [Xylaria scruposa]
MAEQEKDNKAKEERISEKEDQAKDELTSDKEVKSNEDEHIDKDNNAQEEEKVVTPTSFPKFMLLPTELRFIIWEYALPDPRYLRVCVESDDEDEDDDDDDDNDEDEEAQKARAERRRKKSFDKRGFPKCGGPSYYAPELLNPGRFMDFPLAAVCRESREFIIDFGYDILYKDRLGRDGDLFQGPWFCEGRDECEEYTEELIYQISKGPRQGEWLYE